ASEYLVMAATLLEMKSSMLLPNQTIEDPEEEWEEDPRDQLLEKLLEYRKYKEAAEHLKERELEENQINIRQKKKRKKKKKKKRNRKKNKGINYMKNY